LPKDADILEPCPQERHEFFTRQFVHVIFVWLRQLGIVDGVIRRGNDEESIASHHAPHLVEEGAVIINVFDSFEAHHRIDAARLQRHRFARANFKTKIATLIAPLRRADHCLVDIDADDGPRALRQDVGAVPLATRDINDAQPRHQF